MLIVYGEATACFDTVGYIRKLWSRNSIKKMVKISCEYLWEHRGLVDIV